jgi:hypothetical protein
MPSCLDQKRYNGLFSQLLACLQSMQTFHKNKAGAILSYENRTLQSDLQNALGDFTHGLWIERHSTLNGNINVGYCKGLALQHLGLCTAGDPSPWMSTGDMATTSHENIMFNAFVRTIAPLTQGTPPQVHARHRTAVLAASGASRSRLSLIAARSQASRRSPYDEIQECADRHDARSLLTASRPFSNSGTWRRTVGAARFELALESTHPERTTPAPRTVDECTCAQVQSLESALATRSHRPGDAHCRPDNRGTPADA